MLPCLQHVSKLLKHGLFKGIGKFNHQAVFYSDPGAFQVSRSAVSLIPKEVVKTEQGGEQMSEKLCLPATFTNLTKHLAVLLFMPWQASFFDRINLNSFLPSAEQDAVTSLACTQLQFALIYAPDSACLMQDESPRENMMQKARKPEIENTEIHSFMPLANILFSFKNSNNRHVLKEKIISPEKMSCFYVQ